VQPGALTSALFDVQLAQHALDAGQQRAMQFPEAGVIPRIDE
jgi:hypothetical protein